MTRSQQLRDWLAQQDGPQPLSAFVAAFPDMKHVMHLVTSMKRTGLMVGHKGEDGFLRYGLGKVPADRTKASPEVRAARARAREERKRRAQGRLPLAEYLAIKAAEKAARDADPAVIEARKERQREKDRNRKRASRSKSRPAEQQPTVRAPRLAKMQFAAVPAPVAALCSARLASDFEVFLARGGQVERLPALWNQPEQTR